MALNTLDIDVFSYMLYKASTNIIKNEPLLTEIDQKIGDGDHGYGMKSGFQAVLEMLEKKEQKFFKNFFHETGITLIKTMGGASGVLFGSIFIAACDVVDNSRTMTTNQFVEIFEKAVVSISRRGRSQKGDKTMLDALICAAEYMRDALSEADNFENILLAGYEGALYGKEATKSMISKFGRSKGFGTKVLGIEDPGAVSVSLLFEGFYLGFKEYSPNNQKKEE